MIMCLLSLVKFCLFILKTAEGRCEQRSEVFVKIQKIKYIFFLGGGGRGGGQGGGGYGVRVDVNEELKFL